MCMVADGVSEHRVDVITGRFVEFGCSERFELIEIIDKSHVFIRCKGCGNTFTRDTTFLNKSKNHNIECRSCGVHADGSTTPPLSENKRGMDESVVVDYYLKGNSATQTALKFGMNLRRVTRIIDEAGVNRNNQATMRLDDYPSTITGDPWLDEEFVCHECGRHFTRHQYKIAMGRKSRVLNPPKYCSKKCAEKPHRRNTKAKRRARKESLREQEKKTVIPLGDLIERDGGICQLCGGKVDMNDGYFDESGYFHTGKNYPTIDHIKPLSKGGFHVWENVQLAHQACNSAKCDKLVS